jgi:hypothetical protein
LRRSFSQIGIGCCKHRSGSIRHTHRDVQPRINILAFYAWENHCCVLSAVRFCAYAYSRDWTPGCRPTFFRRFPKADGHVNSSMLSHYTCRENVRDAKPSSADQEDNGWKAKASGWSKFATSRTRRPNMTAGYRLRSAHPIFYRDRRCLAAGSH